LRTQVDVVLPQGVAVLNADCDECAGLAPLCDGDVIFYSVNAQRLADKDQALAGRRLITLAGPHAVLQHADGATPLLDTSHSGVQALVQRVGMAALLATLGTAVALQLPVELVRAGLEAAAALLPAELHPTRLAP
jgi:cyanophycin synthetase